MESKKITIVKEGSSLDELTLYWGDEGLENEDLVMVKIESEDFFFEASGDTYFDALESIRLQIEEKNGGVLQCYGAVKNVYPSPMIRSMGEGRKAYFLKLGHQAKMDDIVDIFDVPDDLLKCEYATVEEQENFYSDWIESL